VKIVLAGGGTGGHFYPAIAVYQELKSRLRNIEVHYIAVEKGIESRQLPREYPEIFIHKIRARGFSRPLYNPLNILIILENFLILQKVKELLKDLKPDFAFLTGGYICGPVGIACHDLKIPFFLHEQNYFPGLTNRFLAKKSTRVFLSFEESKEYINCPEEKIVISGNPVRKVKVEKDSILKALELDSNKPLIIVMGGSRGSEVINSNIIKVYELVNQRKLNWQFIHSTGSKIIAQRINFNYRFVRAFTFVNEMVKYISIADAAICRAGATTIAEIIAYRVPAILIPWPNAVDNHQYKNAEKLSKESLSIMIPEEILTPKILFDKLLELIVEKKAEDLKYNLSKVYFGNPAKKIVDIILEYLISERRESSN